MRQFTANQLTRCFNALEQRARPLESALAAFRYQAGSAERVLEALGPYRNPDGGFGNALEPDARTPSSSALATALALRTLHEIGCTEDHPYVVGAISYLVHTYDPTSRVWRALPEDANDYPHAPWWHDDGESLERTFDGFRIIPRALIVCYLHVFSANVPERLLREVTEDTLATLLAIPVLGEGGGSDLEYAVELAECPELPEGHRQALTRRIEQAIPEVIVRDPARWDTYCLHPTRAVRRPGGIGAASILPDVHRYLDYLIETQCPDGSWPTTWTWGGKDPDIWKIAAREWEGILILEHLEVLHAFDRIVSS